MQNERCVLKMKQCPECGAIVNDGEMECSFCGTLLPAERSDTEKSGEAEASRTDTVTYVRRFCADCGEALPYPDAVCPRCSTGAMELMNPKDAGIDASASDIKNEAPKKKKRRKWMGLLLAPAIVLGAYLIAFTKGFLPREVVFGEYTIEFLDISQSNPMKMVGLVCFFVLPLIFFILLASKGSETEEASSEYTDAFSELERNGMLGSGVGHSRSYAPAESEDGEHAYSEQESDETAKYTQNVDANKADEEEMPSDEYEEEMPFDEYEEEEGDLRSYPKLEDLERFYSYKNRVESDNNSERTVSLETLVDDLIGFAASKGVALTAQTVRSMIAAVAADKLIIAEDKNGSSAPVAFYVMAEYFGGSLSPLKVPSGCATAAELARGKKGAETCFLTDVYSACLDHNTLRFAFLSQVEPAEAKEYLSEYVNAISHRNKEMYATVESVRSGVKLLHLEQGKVTVAKNLKLVVSPIIDRDSSVIANERIILDLSDVSSCSESVYERKLNKVSAWQFSETVRIMRESKYLSEDTWKKIDRLLEYLTAKLGYSFDNRYVRMMEVYSSAYMAAGGDAREALDSMLAACVMRAVCEQRIVPSVEEDEEDIAQLIEGLFGAESVPVCIDLARSLISASAEERAEDEEQAAEISAVGSDDSVGFAAEETANEIEPESVTEAETEIEAETEAEIETETETETEIETETEVEAKEEEVGADDAEESAEDDVGETEETPEEGSVEAD